MHHFDRGIWELYRADPNTVLLKKRFLSLVWHKFLSVLFFRLIVKPIKIVKQNSNTRYLTRKAFYIYIFFKFENCPGSCEMMRIRWLKSPSHRVTWQVGDNGIEDTLTLWTDVPEFIYATQFIGERRLALLLFKNAFFFFKLVLVKKNFS